MPKTLKSAQHEQCTIKHVHPEETSEQKETGSDQEQENVEQDVTLSPPQAFPSMFMPYIEGPKMDWTVNDNLYNRFLKWKLKCGNILECELTMLADRKMQESYYLVRRFRDRPICILVPAPRRIVLGCHLDQI